MLRRVCGEDVPCDPGVCPRGGACCFGTSCDFLTESVCAEEGGVFLGEGVPCDPNQCGGACCYEFSSCQFSTEVGCNEGGGTFLGAGLVCDPDPCGVLGACCLEVGCDWLEAGSCEAQGGAYLGQDTVCLPTGCGENAGGVLLLHANPDLAYSTGSEYCGVSDLSDCGLARTTVPIPGEHVFHVIAAFEDPLQPRLRGVTFGIDYDPAIGLLHFGHCGDFELPDGTWPASGSGTAITWNETQTNALIECYWFAAYASYDPGVFSLVPHPIQGALFADDSVPSMPDLIACLGSLGFGGGG